MPEAQRPSRTIRDLLSYRVHRLANALSRGAARRYREAFGVSLMEWRTLALLGDFAPMALKELSLHSGLDKSQVSRVISTLVARGLVLRSTGRDDGREVTLRLSAAGRRTFEGLMDAARTRDDAFLGVLTAEERDALDGILSKLLAEARRQAEPKAWDGASEDEAAQHAVSPEPEAPPGR
ncbi:MarR family winged helix-turn-helix transcriptional regulator [Muricoccus radiodurans]|uniref:MarR family winged helix-turn-helix transcriptional regulator n=1 Tax=Muricoccus radiodurans TaxID=2231721 RepID=UPI003CF440C8